MKSLFELVGFVATALFSGFLVFTYVGHSKKTAARSTNEPFISENNSSSQRMAPAELPEISKNRKGQASAASSPKSKIAAPAMPVGNESEKLRNLYNDASFIQNTARKWKDAVADAADEYTLRPELLLAHIAIKSYTGNYSKADFNYDVAEHAGDLSASFTAASKKYEHAWSVGKIAQQYNLAQHFPNSSPATAMVPKKSVRAAEANFGTSSSTKKAAIAQPQSGKPQAGISAAEAGFRDMVAKDEGYTSWAGLQRLADEETKQQAAQRVKRLLLGARVK